jgi:4-hydroxy-3-methylbut-2-enyl diphosphate reductase
VDDETDVDVTWLRHAKTVAVTAGASAPESLVRRLIDAIAALGGAEVEERTTTVETLQFKLPRELAVLR